MMERTREITRTPSAKGSAQQRQEGGIINKRFMIGIDTDPVTTPRRVLPGLQTTLSVPLQFDRRNVMYIPKSGIKNAGDVVNIAGLKFKSFTQYYNGAVPAVPVMLVPKNEDRVLCLVCNNLNVVAFIRLGSGAAVRISLNNYSNFPIDFYTGEIWGGTNAGTTAISCIDFSESDLF